DNGSYRRRLNALKWSFPYCLLEFISADYLVNSSLKQSNVCTYHYHCLIIILLFVNGSISNFSITVNRIDRTYSKLPVQLNTSVYSVEVQPFTTTSVFVFSSPIYNEIDFKG